jgi:hypothetical protein
MSYSMRAINATQHIQLFTCSCQALKWHPHTWHTDYGVEDGNLHFSTSFLDFCNLGFKLADKPIVFDRVRISDLNRLGRRSLSDIRDCLLACAVDGGEVENVVARLESQVA